MRVSGRRIRAWPVPLVGQSICKQKHGHALISSLMWHMHLVFVSCNLISSVLTNVLPVTP